MHMRMTRWSVTLLGLALWAAASAAHADFAGMVVKIVDGTVDVLVDLEGGTL